MHRTLTIAALSTVVLPGTVLADAIDIPTPAPCPTTQLRHRVLLPFDQAQDVPVNASIWAIEDTQNGGPPLEVIDTTTNEAVALDASYHATAVGVVVQLAPVDALVPGRTYEIRNAGTDARRFTTGSDRDDVAPRAPSLGNGYAQYLTCTSAYGLAVAFDAEINTLTFARRTDGTLIGFAEPSYPLTVAGDLDAQVEFRAYSVDLAGNVGDDSATRRQEIVVSDGATDDGVGCTCAAPGRAGSAAGVLLFPLLIAVRRRLARTSAA